MCGFGGRSTARHTTLLNLISAWLSGAIEPAAIGRRLACFRVLGFRESSVCALGMRFEACCASTNRAIKHTCGACECARMGCPYTKHDGVAVCTPGMVRVLRSYGVWNSLRRCGASPPRATGRGRDGTCARGRAPAHAHWTCSMFALVVVGCRGVHRACAALVA